MKKDRELYQIIKDRKKTHRDILFTLLEEGVRGTHYLVEEDACIWKKEDGEAMHPAKEWDASKTQLLETSSGPVFCERIGHQPKLVICGGGHVSIPIIKMAKMTGFYVTVLEDREYFAERAKEAGADVTLCMSYEVGLAQIAGDYDTYFVIVTRGHHYDTECLRTILQKPYAYVGMMGSKKRVGMIKENLEKEGVSKEQLQELHSPIGLSIGAETPEEIAVSIMAELVQVKNQTGGVESFTDAMLDTILTSEEELAMSMIVSRHGSAPRKIGTRMLTKKDGTIIGTIGGGLAEAEIIKASVEMLTKSEQKTQLLTVSMNAKEAEEAGMVCGGTIQVLIEIIE